MNKKLNSVPSAGTTVDSDSTAENQHVSQPNANTNVSSRFLVGQIVETDYDVFDHYSYPLDKTGTLTNLGKEKFIVTKTEYWQQGEGFIIYGQTSNKRNYEVWHHEKDLHLVSPDGS